VRLGIVRIQSLPQSGFVHRWLAFNTVGLLGIAVQLLALMLFARVLRWNYLIATAAAVESAVLHNFFWHEQWTWAERAVGGARAMGNRLFRFHLSNGAFSLLGNLLLMRLFAGMLGLDLVAANLLAISLCSLVNFLASEHLVFARPTRTRTPPGGEPASPREERQASRRNAMKPTHPIINLRWFPVLSAAVALSGGTVRAAELGDSTLKAWDVYVRATERRIEHEQARQGSFLSWNFLPAPRAHATKGEVLAGSVPVSKLETLDHRNERIDVPGGMIHHWRGSIFIPGVDLSFVLARVENPATGEVRQDDVLHSAVLDRGPGYLKLYLRLQRSKIVTVVYNTEHEIRYQRLTDGRAWSRSTAVKIAEVVNPGFPDEQENPPGRDHGFLWRLNSYWKYEQVRGGVIVECESISLSRSIPLPLEFIARPIIDRVARESMERTLTSLRDRIVLSHNRQARSSASPPPRL